MPFSNKLHSCKNKTHVAHAACWMPSHPDGDVGHPEVALVPVTLNAKLWFSWWDPSFCLD